MKIDSETTCVVVGGASGMGAATVEALRAHEASVVILDANEDKGREIAGRSGAWFYPVDVTNEASVVEGFEQARAHQGQERVLVHTPGGGGLGAIAWRDPQTGAARRHDLARWERIVRLNLTGTFLCASVAAQGMLDLAPLDGGERGTIIMTSSIASIQGPAATGAYAASKAGINGLTLSMARDLAGAGIRVNTILPGNFETPLISGLPADYRATMESWNLFPSRFGQPDEYASFALEIIRNRYFNAGQFRLDGGAQG